MSRGNGPGVLHAFSAERRQQHAAGSVFTMACGRQSQLVALGRALQGVGLIALGVFLLSKMSVAPQLKVQVVLLGSLLVAGGCAFVGGGLVTLTSRLAVDAHGIRGRLGTTLIDVPWDRIVGWRVNDHDDRIPELTSAELVTAGGENVMPLPGGYLDRDARRELRNACRTFAPTRELG